MILSSKRFFICFVCSRFLLFAIWSEFSPDHGHSPPCLDLDGRPDLEVGPLLGGDLKLAFLKSKRRSFVGKHYSITLQNYITYLFFTTKKFFTATNGVHIQLVTGTKKVYGNCVIQSNLVISTLIPWCNHGMFPLKRTLKYLLIIVSIKELFFSYLSN